MAKEIKSAEELKAMLEGQLRAANPGLGRDAQVVIVRTEEGHSNWTASRSGQTGETAAAIDRALPDLQARYDLTPPGEGSA